MKTLKRLPFICTLFLLCFVQLNAYSQYLPNSLWKIRYASSEEPVKSKPSGAARLIIDGDKSTFWHSRYSSDQTLCPHEIQIDLGAMAQISEVVLTPRQNNSSGRCAEYEIGVSVDGTHWSRAKKSSLFWSGNDDFSDKTVTFSQPIRARYISYKHLKSFDNGLVDVNVATLADIRLKGEYISSVVVADLELLNKKQYYTVGEEISVQNISKAYLSSIRNVKWKCPGARVKLDSRNNITLTYDKCGFYDLSLQVSNGRGFTSIKKLDERICILPTKCLDRHKWNIVSFSEEDVELKNFASNMLDSVAETFWCTTWDQIKPLPHNVVFDLGEMSEISGFGYLPRQDNEITGLVTDWKLFVSDNGKDWGQAICSGVWTYKNRNLKIVTVKETKCRFVKFEIEKSLPLGDNYASCAEFYIFGNTAKKTSGYLAWLVGGLLIFLFVVIYKRRSNKPLNPTVANVKPVPVQPTAEIKPVNTATTTQINLFGDFGIISEDKNLTPLFFSKIKQLFVMLLCFPEGISIYKMTALIWPGMPADKATNNRSSIIKNLKTVLADAKGINLEYSNKQWKIVLESSVYCDLYEYNQLIANLSANKDINSITRLCEIIDRGPFLHDMDIEWLDDIKERITGEIIDKFSQLLSDSDQLLSSDLILQIAESMLTFDEVNELAIKTKVKTLVAQQKNSVAKTSFDNFVKKYKLFYNQDYPGNFSSFLQ